MTICIPHTGPSELFWHSGYPAFFKNTPQGLHFKIPRSSQAWWEPVDGYAWQNWRSNPELKRCSRIFALLKGLADEEK